MQTAALAPQEQFVYAVCPFCRRFTRLCRHTMLLTSREKSLPLPIRTSMQHCRDHLTLRSQFQMNDETNSRGISRRDMMRMLAGTGMMVAGGDS